jgi:hypothetical protein
MAGSEINRPFSYLPAEQGWVTSSLSIATPHPVREVCAFRLAILSADFILSAAEGLGTGFRLSLQFSLPLGEGEGEGNT